MIIMNKHLAILSRGVVAILLLGAVACEAPDQSPVIASELEEMEADRVLFSMTHYMTHEGVREGRLEADTAYSWQDSSVISLRNLTLVVYDETGAERAVVTALRGRLDPGTREMYAQGSVVLTVTQGGRVVESEELNYDPNSERIWSDLPTVSREGNSVVEGTGFDSDTEFTNVRIRNARTRGGVRF
jgi:LPS export ABC transporter protein LptC